MAPTPCPPPSPSHPHPRGATSAAAAVRPRHTAWAAAAAFLLPLAAVTTAHGNRDFLYNSTVLRPRDRAMLRVKTSSKRGAGFWKVEKSDFKDANGNLVRFSGVNWSGLETPDKVVHGLNKRSLGSILDAMKSLGFLVVRLPFAGDNLKRGTKPNQDLVSKSSDLKGLECLNIMDKIIDGCSKRGMKVILDYHRMHATFDIEIGTWWDSTASEDDWVNNWVKLATRYKGNTAIIGADLFNEVHDNKAFPSGAPYWQYNSGNNEKYNFRRATIRVMTAIKRVEPGWIFFVEGMWNDHWWGGNCAKVQEAPITGFEGKLALATHEYGPRIYKMPYFSDSNFPNNMEGILRKYWGFAIEKQVLPVVVGEFGSTYPDPNNKDDKTESQAFEAIVAYIKKVKASWTYWQWGPEYPDTGGILKSDWWSVDNKKWKLLNDNIMHWDFW